MALPLALPAVKERDTCPSPAVVDSPVGAAGVVSGVAVTLSLAAPVPTEFTALSRMVYVVPFVNPVITMGEDVDAVLGVT
jgi:hypothetical protein